MIADGARSQLGRRLGRTWHKSTAYGVAARAYIKSHRSDDPWISSHLELRGEQGEVLSGYGWVFPLGAGQVNVGVGTLATDRHPADINLRSLLSHYAEDQRETWRFSGDLRAALRSHGDNPPALRRRVAAPTHRWLLASSSTVLMPGV